MIDWQQVQTLKSDVGADEFDEVLELFFAEVEEAILRLGGAASPDARADILHFLKGAALNLGFDALSACCHEEESAMRQAQPQQPDLSQVAVLYAKSKAAFLSGLGDNRDANGC